MKIVLYSMNFSPEPTGIGKFNSEMARWLTGRGHEVVVVTGPPYYPAWRISEGYRNRYSHQPNEGEVSEVVFRCPIYVPKRLTAFRRLLHLASFAVLSAPCLFVACRRIGSPDVVVVVEPTMFCRPVALLMARCFGASSWLHIQDFEIEAALGLGMIRVGIFGRCAKALDGYLMRKFSRVSTISSSMLKIAKSRGITNRKLVFFPNWVDTSEIIPSGYGERLRDRLGIGPEAKVVLYSGSIGKKQGIEIIAYAADAFRGVSDVLFVVAGQGAGKVELEGLCMELRLRNLRFLPLVPREELRELLAMGDVHLVVQRRGVADAVLPSKLAGILSVGGKCLVTAEAESALGRLCEDFPGVAWRVEPESVTSLTTELRRALEHPCGRFREPNLAARQYAVEYLDQDSILGRFESELVSAATERRGDSGGA